MFSNVINFCFWLTLFLTVGTAKNPVDFPNLCQYPNLDGAVAGFDTEIYNADPSILINFSLWPILQFPKEWHKTIGRAITTQTNFKLPASDTTLFGVSIPTQNILIEFRGYFIPPKSGTYTFALYLTDDGSAMFLGNDAAFPCGNITSWSNPTNDQVSVSDYDPKKKTLTVYMVAGVAYPLRIAYYNREKGGSLTASFVDPDGLTHSDWNGYIWTLPSCDNCKYSPPPMETTTTSSAYVLEKTTSTIFSIYTGVDGEPTPHTLVKVIVPTVTEYIVVPSPTTITTTKNVDGQQLVEQDVISFFSTTNSIGKPITGSTTITIDDGRDKTTTYKDKDGSIHTDIISHITKLDENGMPVVILTRYPAPAPAPGPGEGGSGSNPGTGEGGSGSNPGTGEGGSGSNPGAGEGGSGGSNPVDDGKDKTTVVTDKDGHVHTDIISHITTTDKDGKPTVILTQYQSPTAAQDGTSKTITVDGEEIIEVVHITTYTDSDGHTITSTYTEMFKTLIDAEPQYVGETTQTITTTDTEGHTTTITTTYNIDNNGNTVPIVHSSSNMSSSSSIISSSISSAVSTPSGQDYIITTTGSDGKIETDIVSHITTTVNGKPTTITTTVPCDVSADKDRTTTVTHSNGVIETNVVSHITTTVNGKPTTITTTTTKLNNAHTTTLTNKDGSVDTKIVVGVTTTNQFGQPVITSITYTPKADSHSNNNVGTVAGTKGAAGNNPSGTNKPQTNPTANAGSNGSSPAANAGSAVVPKAPASNSAAVQQQSSASGTTPGASAAPTIQQINKNAASTLKQTKFCVTIVLTILMNYFLN